MRFELVLLFLAGCSLGNVKQEGCETTAQCRDAFGFGSQCGDAGFCEPLVPIDRCTETYPTDLMDRPEQYQDVVVFGTLFNFASDIDNRRSVELAFDEAQIDGGLNGRDVALVHCNYTVDLALDPLDDAEAAIETSAFLLDEVGVQGLIGPGSSQLVLDVWDTTSARDAFVMAPSATSDELTDLVDSDTGVDLFWRTAPPDVDQSVAIAADLTARSVAEMAIIYQRGAYGDGLSDSLISLLTVDPLQVYPYENRNQLTAAVEDAGVAAVTEVLFISSDPVEVAAFLNAAAGTANDAYGDKGIFLTDSARDAEVLEGAVLAADLFDNIRGSNPIPDPATSNLENTFYTAFSLRYGEDAERDGFNTFSYDAAWLSLYASAWADQQEGGISGAGLVAGMQQVSSGTPTPIRAASWLDVQESFANGEAIDVFGASGNLDFDSTTGETQNPIAIWTVNAAGNGFDNVQVCYVTGCEAL